MNFFYLNLSGVCARRGVIQVRSRPNSSIRACERENCVSWTVLLVRMHFGKIKRISKSLLCRGFVLFGGRDKKKNCSKWTFSALEESIVLVQILCVISKLFVFYLLIQVNQVNKYACAIASRIVWIIIDRGWYIEHESSIACAVCYVCCVFEPCLQAQACASGFMGKATSRVPLLFRSKLLCFSLMYLSSSLLLALYSSLSSTKCLFRSSPFDPIQTPLFSYPSTYGEHKYAIPTLRSSCTSPVFFSGSNSTTIVNNFPMNLPEFVC